VGLIVAKVVTNAFKHAFPHGRGGEVSMRVRKLGLDAIEVEVRYDGPGFTPDNDDASYGLGTRLIAALTDQLRGQVAAYRKAAPCSGSPSATERVQGCE